MDKSAERFRHFEKLTKKMESANLSRVPPSCRKCPYVQPDFKYRTCLYVRCPYQKHHITLRRRPLQQDKITQNGR